MDVYTFSLWLGFAGMGGMAVGGLGHGHGGAHGHGLGHGHGHGLGHGSGATHGSGSSSALTTGGHGAGHGTVAAQHGAAGHGVGQHGAAPHGAHGAGQHGHEPGAPPAQGAARQEQVSSLLSWLSPRVLFSVILGFGATGTLLHDAVAATYLLPLSVAGGFSFDRLVVSPLWNSLTRFASTPARTLETGILEEARAVTGFDASGCGLISLDFDGQVMQVLGRLRADERASGVKVRAGDRLIVEEVDAKRNTCTVSRLDRQD